MALTDSIPFVFPGVSNVQCAFQKRALPIVTSHKSELLQPCDEMAGGNISHDVQDNPVNVKSARIDLMLRLNISHWGELKQVHGDKLVIDPDHVPMDSPAHVEADGSATDQQGLALVIKTADCQPILLAHSSGKYIAAIHAGWRGNHLSFPATAVQRFCETYGIAARDVLAVRGPSLGPSAAEFVNFDTEWGTRWKQWFNASTQTMNLWQLTHHQLQEAGIQPENIFALDLCTYSLADSFFSYRRGCKTNMASGRQASLIWIKE